MPSPLYIISFVLYNCYSYLYADIVTLYSCADSIHAATQNLQLSFNLLQKHFHNLKLSQNCTKTKWMLFSNAKNIDYNSCEIQTVNNTEIERVQYSFGNCIDENLTFGSLVSKLRIKLRFHFRNKSCFLSFT